MSYVETFSKKINNLIALDGSVEGIGDHFEQGIKFLNEMDKELTHIKMVAADKAIDIDKLRSNFNDLAIELGKTTTEITSLGKALYEQGLSSEEVSRRLKVISKTASVIAADVGDVTKMTTEFYNEMGVEVEEFTDLIAKMGRVAGVSAKDVGVAMEASSEAASKAGVGVNELASYVTAMEEITGDSGETIGANISKMITNLNQAKGDGYNTALKALEKVDIDFKDVDTGKLKEINILLEEISGKWNTWSKNTKKKVAGGIGVNQLEQFSDLMNNWERIKELQNEAKNSKGEIDTRYEAYLESTEAKLKGLKSAAENMWIKLFDQDVVNQGIEMLRDIIVDVDELVNHSKGLGITVAGLILLFRTLKKSMAVQGTFSVFIELTHIAMKEQGLLAGATFSARMAVEQLGVSLKALVANPVTIVLASIGLLIGIFAKLADQKRRVREETEKNREKIMGLSDSLNQELDEIDDLNGKLDEHKKLQKQIADNTGDVEEAKKKLHDIEVELAIALPSATSKFDDQNKALATNNELIKKSIELKKENAITEARGIIYSINPENELERLKELRREEIAFENLLGAGGKLRSDRAKNFVNIQGKSMGLEDDDKKTIKHKNKVVSQWKDEEQALAIISAKYIEYHNKVNKSVDLINAWNEAANILSENGKEEFELVEYERLGINPYKREVKKEEDDPEDIPGDEKFPEKEVLFKGAETDEFSAGIKDLDNQLEVHKKSISEIVNEIEKLKIVGGDDRYSKIIEKENEKLEEQKDYIKDIKEAQSKTNSFKNNFKDQFYNSFNKDLDKMSQEDIAAYKNFLFGEDIDFNDESDIYKYSKRFGSQVDFSNAEQAKEDVLKLKKLYDELIQKYDKTVQKGKQLQDQEISSQKDIDNTVKSIWNTQFEEWKNNQEDKKEITEELYRKHEKLNEEDENNYTGKKKIIEEIIDAEEEYLILLTDQNSKMELQVEKLESKAQLTEEERVELNRLNEEMDKYEDAIQNQSDRLDEQKNKLKELNQEKVEFVKSVQDEVIEVIKKVYEEEYNESKKVLEDEWKEFEKKHNLKIEAYNDEKKAFKELTDEKIRQLDREKEKKDHKDDINELTEKKLELQAKYDALSMDSSIESEIARQELKKQMEEVQENIDNKQEDYTYKISKENINEELKKFNKVTDEKIKSEKEMFDAEKEGYEESLEALKDNYDKMLQEGNLYSQAKMAIENGYFENLDGKHQNLIESINTVKNQYNDGLSSIGSKIKSDLIDNLEKANELIKSMSYGLSESEKDMINHMDKGSVYIDGKIYSLDELNNKMSSDEIDELMADAKRVYIKGSNGEIWDYKSDERVSFGERKIEDDGNNMNSSNVNSLDQNTHNEKGLMSKNRIAGNFHYMPKGIESLRTLNIPNLKSNFLSTNKSMSLSVDNLINVQGDMNKNVLPKLENVANSVLSMIQKEFNKKGLYGVV